MEMSARDRWIIIGISGVTCGGKTTLANKLKKELSPCYLFHQDKYFYPDDSARHVRCAGLAARHHDYDVLSALDMDAMLRDITMTLEGVNRSHGMCEEGSVRAEGKNFMIVEGFTVLNYKPIADICDLRYYFILSYGECLSRRVLRLYDPPDVDGYFDKCVWPRHLQYREEIEKDSRVKLLDGTQPDSLDIVLRDVSNYNK